MGCEVWIIVLRLFLLFLLVFLACFLSVEKSSFPADLPFCILVETHLPAYACAAVSGLAILFRRPTGPFLVPVPHSVYYCSVRRSLKIPKRWSSNFVLVSQCFFTLFCSLCIAA